jgi:Protein of unknown function (DUF1173)
MTDTRFFIRGRMYLAVDPDLLGALAAVHDSPERPRCMCVPGGVPMYVARHGSTYLAKRMPETGPHHQPTCPSFEPEGGSSGLDEMIGDAIVECGPDHVELRTKFPLTRRRGRGVSRGPHADGVPGGVEVAVRPMSLRGLLHYLYGRAQLNRWYPAMEGRRSQGVLHKYLNEAARGVMIKGVPLSQRLYVPESFRPEDSDAIAARRHARLAPILAPGAAGEVNLAILIGEFKTAHSTPFGHRIQVRHMPDAPLQIDDTTWKRAQHIYGPILRTVDADVLLKPRVLMVALVRALQERLYGIDTLAMMLVTDQWLPLEGLHELPLIDLLQSEKRTFIKPMSGDSKVPARYASAILLDHGGPPLHLHVISLFANPKERAVKEKVIAGTSPAPWVWHTHLGMPTLPSPAKCCSGLTGARATPPAAVASA